MDDDDDDVPVTPTGGATVVGDEEVDTVDVKADVLADHWPG